MKFMLTMPLYEHTLNANNVSYRMPASRYMRVETHLIYHFAIVRRSISSHVFPSSAFYQPTLLRRNVINFNFIFNFFLIVSGRGGKDFDEEKMRLKRD